MGERNNSTPLPKNDNAGKAILARLFSTLVLQI